MTNRPLFTPMGRIVLILACVALGIVIGMTIGAFR
jgi:hypothetical protein